MTVFCQRINKPNFILFEIGILAMFWVGIGTSLKFTEKQGWKNQSLTSYYTSKLDNPKT